MHDVVEGLRSRDRAAAPMCATHCTMAAPAVTSRIKLKEVNAHLTCHLCKGYYIDATTIVECLHSFCRSCIIQHLQFKCYCPVCEMMINKAKPNIKPDKTLQDIVYKLVPGLHRDEMRRRREFYQEAAAAGRRSPRQTGGGGGGGTGDDKSHGGGGGGGDGTTSATATGGPAAADTGGVLAGCASPLRLTQLSAMTPEQRGEDNERVIYNTTDPVSLSLEYCASDSNDPGVPNILTNNNETPNSGGKAGSSSYPPTRYLQCPAGMTVRLLKKFVVSKFDINVKQFHIDVLYKRVPLPDTYTLMDIAYIYSWKRNEPMRLFYRVTDIKYAVDRFDFFEPASMKRKLTVKPLPRKTPDPPKAAPKNDPTTKCAPAAKSSRLNGDIATVAAKPHELTNNNKKPSSDIKSDTKSVTGHEKQVIKRPVNGEHVSNSAITTKESGAVKLSERQDKPRDCKVKQNGESLLGNKHSENCRKEVSGGGGTALEPEHHHRPRPVKCAKKPGPKSQTNPPKSPPKTLVKSETTPIKPVNGIKNTMSAKLEREAKAAGAKLDREHAAKSVKLDREVKAASVAVSSSTSVLCDEDETEKSVFLNTFELTSTKSLSPKKIESPSTSGVERKTPPLPPPLAAPTKISPKKTPPKTVQTSPGSSRSTAKPTASTSKQHLPFAPKSVQTAPVKSPSSSSPALSMRAILPKAAAPPTLKPVVAKRKYTFKNGRPTKKARLEAAALAAATAANSAPPKVPVNSTVNAIVQNVTQQTSAVNKMVNVNASEGALKRKSVSFKLDEELIPEKRPCPAATAVPESVGKSAANPLKSLFDNCNLNIPSSLSITLTEGPSEKDQSAAVNQAAVKRQSPPVNMYIEIFKIPDKNEASGNNNAVVVKTASNGDAAGNGVGHRQPPPTPPPPPNSAKDGGVNALPPPNLRPTNVKMSIANSNLVVTTTGIQSLGRKDTAAAPALPPPLTLCLETLGVDKSEEKSPLTAIPSNMGNSLRKPSLVDSPKSSTGFQKMFEEAIKRKEAAKALEKLKHPSNRPPGVPKRILPKPPAVDEKKPPPICPIKKPQLTVKTGQNTHLSTSSTALDLSSPNGGNKGGQLTPFKSHATPPPPRLSPGLMPQPPPYRATPPSPLPPPPSQPLPSGHKNSPQSNLISSTEQALAPASATTPLSVNVASGSRASAALSPTAIQQQYNITNLVQFRQVMLLRQSLELRNRLLQNPPSDTLLQFESYMKNLQQAHQNATAKK